MVFTTRISVSSMYRTSSVVTVSIVWLYFTVVVVMIPLSIIVSWLFFSLLFFFWVVCIVYDMACSRIYAASNILLNGGHISFDASLLCVYVNNVLGALFQM